MSTGLLKATSMPRSSTRKTYCCQGHHFQQASQLTTTVLCDWSCDEPCQEEKNTYLPPGTSQGVFSEVPRNWEVIWKGWDRLLIPWLLLLLPHLWTSRMDGWPANRSCNTVRREKTMSPRRVSRLDHRLLTSKVELFQLLSLFWRTAVSTLPLCCAHAMTMPCASSQPVKKTDNKIKCYLSCRQFYYYSPHFY